MSSVLCQMICVLTLRVFVTQAFADDSPSVGNIPSSAPCSIFT